MNLNRPQMHTDQPLLDILSFGVPFAVTAPLLLDDQFLVGYYSPDSSGCAVIPAADAYVVSLLYQPKTCTVRVHALKRIWEVMQIGTRDVNLDLIHDTKLMAYLLDPDADNERLT